MTKHNGTTTHNRRCNYCMCVAYMDHLQPRQQLACVYLQSCHGLRTAAMAELELKAARWHPEPGQRSVSVDLPRDSQRSVNTEIVTVWMRCCKSAVVLKGYPDHNAWPVFYFLLSKESAYSINFRINTLTPVSLIHLLCYSITGRREGPMV